MSTQVERYGEVRSVLLYAEIRAVISLKWPVIRPYYVTIRWSYTVTFWCTAVGNRIATVHGCITGHFNDITARISAYNNPKRMRTRIRPVLFVLGSLGDATQHREFVSNRGFSNQALKEKTKHDQP